MTKYLCVECGDTWEVEDGYNELSGGLCLPCLKEGLKPLYRKRQRREGNFDCFGRANNYCDQEQCAYRKICLD